MDDYGWLWANDGSEWSEPIHIAEHIGIFGDLGPQSCNGGNISLKTTYNHLVHLAHCAAKGQDVRRCTDVYGGSK